MATRQMLLMVHVVPATAILKAHVVETVTQSPANVAASRASQAGLATSVSRVTQWSTASVDVRLELFNSI